MYREVDRFRALLQRQGGTPPTLVEASVLHLCATALRRPSGPAAWFDTAVAAHRFAAALAGHLGEPVPVARVRSGIRRHFHVHRVLLEPARAADAYAGLDRAWRAAVELVTDVRPVSPSAPRWRRRRGHAADVWRAMLLAGAPVRRADGLRLRVCGPELATVAIRCARLLGAPAELRRDGGGLQVALAPREAHRLLATVADAEPAAAAVPVAESAAESAAAAVPAAAGLTGAARAGCRRAPTARWAGPARRSAPVPAG
ncbi:MAG TPA: hypothetical protein VNV66_13610 [Pilimelia sp.]|nr:hypothetical protein [Pilimelia sp.]